MHLRIWLLLLSLGVLAGCAAPPPAEEAPSATEESMAAPEASPEAASDGVLAGEGFESGRSETLQPAEASSDEHAE